MGIAEESVFTGPTARDAEILVIRWFKALWAGIIDEYEKNDKFDLENPTANKLSDYFGYVTTGSSECNLMALLMGREKLPRAPVVISGSSHYSYGNAAFILNFDSVKVLESDQHGSWSMEAFQSYIKNLDTENGIIIGLTCSTTMTGFYDPIAAIIKVCDEYGFPPEKRYIHVDGALGGMLTPLLRNMDPALSAGYHNVINSISTSAHKWLATNDAGGIFVGENADRPQNMKNIEYVGSINVSPTGSRSGMLVYEVFSRIMGTDIDDMRNESELYMGLAKHALQILRRKGIDAHRHEWSPIIYFPKTTVDIREKYGLATQDGVSHIVIMPGTSINVVESAADDISKALPI